MQRYTWFQSAPRKRKTRSPFVAVFLVLVAGAVVWALLYSKPVERSSAREQQPSPASARSTTPARTAAQKTSLNSIDTRGAAAQTAHGSSGTTQVPVDTNHFPRPALNAFEVQLALARQGISPGSLDGVPGARTRLALVAFQQRENLTVTGALDASTRNRLLLDAQPFTNYIVTANDLARMRPLGKTWLEKSQQDRLDYETILEWVAEKAQSNPHLIRQFNPSVDWTNVIAGTSLTLPNVERPAVREKAALARIHLEERTLQAFGENTNLLAHFPCSIAAFAQKRPVGELHVAAVALNPNYTFDPDNFPESAEARELNRKLILPPGPNNPVGTVWIGLDRPGYGIHGTPRPEQVGRAESHGCFRLANWNAEFFSQMVWVGMPVFVEP